MSIRLILIAMLIGAGHGHAQESSFYKRPALFSTRPDATKSLNEIKRFGPVGIGIELHRPAFVMKVKNVEKGSPAEAAGKLKPGQVIEAINGQVLADIDPRIQLGQILAEAEATDGKIDFTIKGLDDPVTVQLPVLGAYSPTWPLDCAKSNRIVRGVADYLSRPDTTEGLGGIGMLFLLSTGDDNDLQVVREWARKAPAHSYPWYVGYGGIPLAECYLRTGDPEILANIQRWVDSAARTQHNDAWAGRGSALTGYGSGHLNAAGTHVVTFLLLAKECGAVVPDRTMHRALRHFYRYAGRGNNPYGDDRPFTGFVDNGKNGKLAIAMAAAAALTPDGENSVYAAARDVCAMQGFYTTTFMLHGHTGGGIGEIWRSAAMGLLHDKRPKQYREFMDNRKWHYDLSRRFDGSFGILGGSGYDKELWGVAYPLAYTFPRKTLRITGAPRTQYSRPYQLPVRPWGTPADDMFVERTAVPDRNGDRQDLSGETLARDSSLHFLRRFHGAKQPTDQEIRDAIHHAEFNIRHIAAFKALGINSGYIGARSSGGKVRPHLVSEFAQHPDPRVRRAIFGALVHRSNAITPEIFDLAVNAMKDPNESWWVKDAAIQIVGKGSVDRVLPLVDDLLPFLEHEDSWLRNAALTALTPVATHEQCYRKVLPAMGELIRQNQRVSITLGLAPKIRAQIKAAGPEVRKLATETLRATFTGFEGKKVSPAGQNLKPTFDYHLEAIAASLADVPGGLDVLYEIARKRHPDQLLPYKELFLGADPEQMGPELREAITRIVVADLIPEFVGKNRRRLRPLAANTVQSAWPGGRGEPVDALAALYKRAGQDAFEWRMFADLRTAEWNYHSFDPIPAEQVPFDQLISRYREVTLPEGMERFYARDFDPAAAGWRTGRSPFGTYDGKLPTRPITKCSAGCVGPGCYGATKVNTLWEKEVLLLQQTFEIPPLRDGYRYRLRVNTGEHVGSGGGHVIYVNGKRLVESKQGGGRGSGGRPKGAYINDAFLDDFKSGKVTIAIQTFIRYNAKYKASPRSKTPQGKFSIHLDEQKLPPMGDDLVFQSASVVGMTSSDWQAKLAPEDASQDPDDNLFRWTGAFEPNPPLAGTWKIIAQVPELDAFDATKRRHHVRNPPFDVISLDHGGKTSHPLWAWSGDTLLNLDRYEALKAKLRQVGGKTYLFLESGGFSTRHKPGWRTRWFVLERQPPR